MTENEFLLTDRLQKIRQIINKYGEENFYISFSGGKDSTVLSWLIDKALPNNRIPRVYANTGIELNMIRDFVFELQKSDDRIEIIKPSKSIKKSLEEDGYPFKSKAHSRYVNLYNKGGLDYVSVRAYVGLGKTRDGRKAFRPCPEILKYQFGLNGGV